MNALQNIQSSNGNTVNIPALDCWKYMFKHITLSREKKIANNLKFHVLVKEITDNEGNNKDFKN